MKQPTEQKCFVISAIGRENTAERETADLIFHLIIKPAAKACRIKPFRADHTQEAGSIIEQMHHDIQHSAFCIAVLSKNPNVLYEIGVAHAMRKLVIILKREEEELPFDIKHLRAVNYSLHVPDLEAIRARLMTTIESSRQSDWEDSHFANMLFGRPKQTRIIQFTGRDAELHCKMTAESVILPDPQKLWRYEYQSGTIAISGETARLNHQLHITTPDRKMHVTINGMGIVRGGSIFLHYSATSLKGDGISWCGTQVINGLEVADDLFGCWMAANSSHGDGITFGRYRLTRNA